MGRAAGEELPEPALDATLEPRLGASGWATADTARCFCAETHEVSGCAHPRAL